MIKRGATSLEIAAAFPARTWDAIGQWLQGLGATSLDFPRPYRGHLTYQQYLEMNQPETDGDQGRFETCNRKL